MINFRPPQYRPRMSQVVVPAVEPIGPVVSTAPAGVGFPEGLFWTALAGAAAWAAIDTARRSTGFKQVAGWAGGIAAGLAALTGLTGILAPSVSRGLPIRWYF